MDTSYDVVIVGTGFAAAFFLKRYLEKAPPNARVLVLERGGSDTKAWQLANRATSSIPPEDVFVNSTPGKAVANEPWIWRQLEVLARRHDANDAG